MAVSDTRQDATSRLSAMLYDPKIRGIVSQVVLAILLVVLVWWIIGNTAEKARFPPHSGPVDTKLTTTGHAALR